MKTLNFKTKYLSILSIVFLAAASSTLSANPGLEGDYPLDNLEKMAVLENGRKKPLDTFAQNVLKQFSGRSTLRDEPAVRWMARVLFAPATAVDDRVFLVNHPEVLHALGLGQEQSGRDRDRYSFSQLRQSIPRLQELAFQASKLEAEERSLVDTELIILYNKLHFFRRLRDSLSFALPQYRFTPADASVRQLLGLPPREGDYCFLDIFKRFNQLKDTATGLEEKNRDRWTPAEKEASRLYEAVSQWVNSGGDSPLKIIPAVDTEEERWMAPWETISLGFVHRLSGPEELDLLSEAVQAFNRGDGERFDASLLAFNRRIIERSMGKVDEKGISLEILYNRIDPFYKAEFFYGFSLLLLLLGLLVFPKWMYRSSFLLLAAGLVLHTLGLVLRIMIMGRPPVTNLYETFVFTGWVAALLGVVLELFKKKKIGVLTGSLAGLAMLLIAGKYATEGDTMGMLVAVLDSNFWLATHVITITLGYAGIVISGAIGHLYVLQRIFKPGHASLLKNTFQAVYATQAFGLIFTFVGTVLGGIWADQSWGRFWGWDPKENGALLIVLWSAVLFHGRLAKWIKELGMSLGAVVGTITVVLAWFGVNLLGVGLHSYGFTSGIARGLLLFIVFELLFIAATGAIILNKEKRMAR